METLVSAITEGVRISVSNRYEEQFSNPHSQLYLFSYEITIENSNSFSVQLLSRYWRIVDSNLFTRVVQGDGVVGETPQIAPGHSYTYRSSCDFQTDLGTMEGQYEMKNLETGKLFDVAIPRFNLAAPMRLN